VRIDLIQLGISWLFRDDTEND